MTKWDPNWVIAVFTVVLVIITGVYAFLTYRLLRAAQRQASIQADALRVQNRLLHSQILAQRFEMYWKTYAPISDEEIDQVALIPEDWMNPARFQEKYRDDKPALRRYLSLVKCYEYLALMSTMKKLEVPDPLGYTWSELWAKDLSRNPEFLEINEWYRAYYPEFSDFVDSLQERPPAAQQPVAGDAQEAARA